MASLLDTTLGKSSEIYKKSPATQGDPKPTSSRMIAKIDQFLDTSSNDYSTRPDDESLPKQFVVGEGSNTSKERAKYQ